MRQIVFWSAHRAHLQSEIYKMKKIFSFTLFFLLILFSSKSWARPTIAIGAFGGGSFQLVNTFPDLDPGTGGGISFEYRFNQHWGIETALSVFDYDGKGGSQGDSGILLLNVPDVKLKFYFFSQEHKIDPYVSAGLGLSVLTDGRLHDNSGGVGLGANVALGSDFYINHWVSFGIETEFRSIGLIRSNSQSSALVFLAALGNFTFHFR